MSTCNNNGLKLFGDYWSLRIIDVLSKSEKRFCEIERLIPETNPITLTNRLKKLDQIKIIAKAKKTIDKISVTYKLTEKGKAIIPILKNIKKYSKNYL